MNGVKLLFLSHYRRHFLLLGVASGFILGCSEPTPPVPKTILAPLRPLSTLSNTDDATTCNRTEATDTDFRNA